MPGKVYFKNKEWVYLYCSNDFATLAGFSSENELIGKTDYDLPWKMQASTIASSDHVVFNTKQNIVMEETITLLNKKASTFKFSKILIAHPEGEIIGILGTLTDSVKQKPISNLIEDNANIALENIMNNMPAHIFWKDKNCILLGCNDLQAKHMGFLSGKQLIGKSNLDVIWPGLYY